MTRLAVFLPIAAAVLAVAGCGSVGRTTEGETSRGKQLFSENCGSCHVLADAGTQGRIGPNLDEAFGNLRSDKPGQGFKESTIRDVVRGQIAYPVEEPVTEAPGMPADLVTGEDADAVAAYVASVAGLPVREGGAQAAGGQAGGGQAGGGETGGGQAGGGQAGGGQAGDATDGKTIFTTNCASCHTLADAEANGTIGPNLDQAKPSRELAVERVTNGKGAMPPFKGQLSDEQIEAVAEYVATRAGR